MKRRLMLILTLALSLTCCLSAAAKQKDTHHVKVGYYNIPGYHNLTANGERSGYGYDFLQLVRRYSKLEFTYTGYEKSWEESLHMLDAGEIDLLTGALRTPDREKVYDYSMPIGSTYVNLYVNNYDVRFQPGKYATYEGMRIGTVASEILDSRLQRFSSRNRFRCTIVSFDDFESMCKALDDKKVDAICAIGTHLIAGYRILESFDNENIYAIVRKGNRQLLSSLNDAIMQMDQSMEMWTSQLFDNNYLGVERKALEFSDQEKTFIRRHSTLQTAIKVATDDNWRPYSWYEHGAYHGIVVEILDKLMKQAGLKYEFVRGNITNESILEQNPDVSLYTCFASTSQYAEEHRLVASSVFMLPSVAVVSLKPYGQLKSIGLAENTPMLNKSARKRFDYDFVTYPTTEELLAAVKKGKVDGAMLYDLMAQLYVNSEDKEKMQINFIPDMPLPLQMVSRMEDDRELITILSKCIDQLTQKECSNIATKYISPVKRDKGLWDYMKDHPWLPVVVLLISLSGFLIEKYQRMRIVQKKDAQARRLAEEANNAKTSFLFNMSHDIRTPMNAIMGFRDLLEKNQEDPVRRAGYLRKIDDASRVLLSIINNVLEMARIEKGTIELNESAWSADQFADIIYSIFADMMEKKGLAFTQKLNIQHPYIYCDPIKLREIFFNLLSNAYKYTPRGSVHMQVDEIPCDRTGWVCYKTTISDTGIGMSDEFLPHVFDEFSRENNTTDGKVEGTGLGMPIVKRLVTLMGGTIEVESTKGEGTTFTVVIPHRIADRSSLVDHAGVVVDPKLFDGKRILLAEDNELNAEIAIEILGEQGFKVEHAADGLICCEMLEAAPAGYYDLVLMDVQMPNLNGYEATRRIRQMADSSKSLIPVLAMTANAFEEDKRDAMQAGMNGHLAKPIDVHELMKTLASTIQG